MYHICTLQEQCAHIMLLSCMHIFLNQQNWQKIKALTTIKDLICMVKKCFKKGLENLIERGFEILNIDHTLEIAVLFIEYKPNIRSKYGLNINTWNTSAFTHNNTNRLEAYYLKFLSSFCEFLENMNSIEESFYKPTHNEMKPSIKKLRLNFRLNENIFAFTSFIKNTSIMFKQGNGLTPTTTSKIQLLSIISIIIAKYKLQFIKPCNHQTKNSNSKIILQSDDISVVTSLHCSQCFKSLDLYVINNKRIITYIPYTNIFYFITKPEHNSLLKNNNVDQDITTSFCELPNELSKTEEYHNMYEIYFQLLMESSEYRFRSNSFGFLPLFRPSRSVLNCLR